MGLTKDLPPSTFDERARPLNEKDPIKALREKNMKVYANKMKYRNALSYS